MKLQFEPYVLEPFDDFYKFPHEQMDRDEHLTYRDYQTQLADLQYDYVQRLRDWQREQHDRLMELHKYYYEQGLNSVPGHATSHEYPIPDRLHP
jgi:hypothetical protein